MQTTLLAVAIAIILALVAALVGPLLIDWGTYRALIERETSRLAGVEVRVNGGIDARLLPSPQLTLRNIEIGNAPADTVKAGALDIEFSLAPLMRGEWRASELRVTAPQLHVGLDAGGRIQAPELAFGFQPDALSIDRLSIVNGTVTLTDAGSGASVTLERFYFNGEATSLVGPFQGEGDVVIAGSHYPYRINTGRYDEAGAIKLRLNVDPRDRPLNFQADGTLSFDGGPKFKGKLGLSHAALLAVPGSGQLSQPWHLRSKIDAGAASALLEDVDFQYGAEEWGLKLTGVGHFQFGKQPRFKSELTGRQINLDRVLTGKQDDRSSAAAALRKLAELTASAIRPAVPIEIGIGIDQVTLAGNAVQNVRGDIASEDNGWNLTGFEFRAPGFTQARLSGHLAVADTGVTFVGPTEIESTDPKALAAWLEGRDPDAQSDLRRLRLRGDVTFGSEKIAVDRLTAEFARKTVTGRFAYLFAGDGRPSKFEAALNAPELDLDVAIGFGKALFAGSQLQRPHDMTVTADIGRATIAGIEGRDISAQVKVDADRWQIDRLSVADLGGAAFSASGRIVLAQPAPQGSMRVDLDAPDLTPVVALLAQFAPKTAKAFVARAPAMAPARLHAQFTVDRNGPARLAIDGSLGKARLAFAGEGQADLKTFQFGNVRLNGSLAADDGRALVTMLGLDSMIAAASGPGALTLKADGPLAGTLRLETRLTAGGLDAGVEGSVRPFTENPSATLRAAVTQADAAPLRAAGEARTALPVTFAGNLALSAKELALNDIMATVAGSAVRGKLAVALTRPHRVQGEIEADTVDAPALIAAAIGMPAPAAGRGLDWAWSEIPFSDGAFGDFAGTVTLKVRQLDVLPRLTVRAFRSTLRLGKNELAFDDIAAVVAGGRIAGALSFGSGSDGLTAKTKIALDGVDAATLLRSAARPPIVGTLGLSVEAEGTGLSPVALVGSLHGAGKITLSDAEFAGLDPHAFDAVTRAVDQGLPVEADRISGVVRRALDSGQLSVTRARGSIAINAGQVRLGDATTESRNAALSLSGNLDLIDGSLDARLVLSGTSKAAGDRPDIFMALKGPVAAPARSIDVSALSGWLTLRAIENQARRVQELEEIARREREAEQKRREAEQKRREAEQRLREEAERERREAERRRREAEQHRLEEAARKHREAEQKRVEEAAGKRGEAAPANGPAAVGAPIFMPPVELSPVGPGAGPLLAPRFEGREAPALPAPIEIHPAPTPGNGMSTPAPSVGPQR